MNPLEPKPPEPSIVCRLLFLDLLGHIHCINWFLRVQALKVVNTRSFSRPSQGGLVLDLVHFHGVLGVQILESGTSMSKFWVISLQSRQSSFGPTLLHSGSEVFNGLEIGASSASIVAMPHQLPQSSTRLNHCEGCMGFFTNSPPIAVRICFLVATPSPMLLAPRGIGLPSRLSACSGPIAACCAVKPLSFEPMESLGNCNAQLSHFFLSPLPFPPSFYLGILEIRPLWLYVEINLFTISHNFRSIDFLVWGRSLCLGCTFASQVLFSFIKELGFVSSLNCRKHSPGNFSTHSWPIMLCFLVCCTRNDCWLVLVCGVLGANYLSFYHIDFQPPGGVIAISYLISSCHPWYFCSNDKIYISAQRVPPLLPHAQLTWRHYMFRCSESVILSELKLFQELFWKTLFSSGSIGTIKYYGGKSTIHCLVREVLPDAGHRIFTKTSLQTNIVICPFFCFTSILVAPSI